jgi:uncharacterized protein YndB with AHSA1/START domain
MTVQSVQQTIRIRATPEKVWNALIHPEPWMGNAKVESTWTAGAPIAFTGTLHGHPYQDRGTVLACEPARFLRYNHWSGLSHVPDSDRTRSVISFALRPDGQDTILEVNHENLRGKAAFGHARFFWRNALVDMKTIAESGNADVEP